jgi:glycosyltransferase involved in cell wall biosynthesis
MPVRDGRVRVAYLVPPSAHFAGIERVVHEIASGLVEKYGHILDVHVLFCSAYDDDLLREPAYTMHVLGAGRLRHVLAAIRRCVAQHDFDVLVCPQVEASVVAWVATRGLGLEIFLPHLHGNPRIEESRGSRRSKVAFQLFRHVLSRRVPAVLAVSPSLASYAARALSRGAPVLYAPNPVRVFADAGRPAREDGRVHFLNVARLSFQKGQDILLQALARARPELPPVTLTLVGSGPDEQELRRLCTRLGLDDVVRFAGYAADPAEHFRAADCFVLSSRWEGFGVVLVEALSCGLPLLATDCEFGPADVITDPRLGNLVAVDDVAALADGLLEAARRRPDPGAEDYRRAVARSYSRGETSARHVEILREIVTGDPPADGRLAALLASSAPGER